MPHHNLAHILPKSLPRLRNLLTFACDLVRFHFVSATATGIQSQFGRHTMAINGMHRISSGLLPDRFLLKMSRIIMLAGACMHQHM